MTKGSYPHPEDEFDAEPGADTPIGVHRAPRSWWSRWWPFAAVVVLVPVITVAAVLWASSWDGLGTSGDDAAAGTTQSATEDPVDTTTDAAVADDPTTDGTGELGDTGEGTDGQASEETAPVDDSTPDYTLPVEVVNAARVSGLAAGASDTLTSAGFTSVTTGNGETTLADVTTVFYSSADQLITAQTVAGALGVSSVVESAQMAPDGIVVVLRADFAN